MLTITHSHAEGTIVHGTSKGDGTNTIGKAHGLRWSRHLGAWFVPRSRDRDANLATINAYADALGAAGHEVEIDINDTARPLGDRLAAESQRAEDRSEALHRKASRQHQVSVAEHAASSAATAGIPFGQPILVGHHSERRHRNDLARSHRHMDNAVAASDQAKDAERRAAAAAATAQHKQAPTAHFAGRRIRELEAELRRIDRNLTGRVRTLTITSDGQRHVEVTTAAGDEYAVTLTARKERAQADLDHWTACYAAHVAAGTAYTPQWCRDNIKPGDAVQVSGTWARVTKLNKTSVTLDTPRGYTTRIARFDQLTAHHPAQTAD